MINTITVNPVTTAAALFPGVTVHQADKQSVYGTSAKGVNRDITNHSVDGLAGTKPVGSRLRMYLGNSEQVLEIFDRRKWSETYTEECSLQPQ